MSAMKKKRFLQFDVLFQNEPLLSHVTAAAKTAAANIIIWAAKKYFKFIFVFCLTRWYFELKYHNRTLLINASYEIDDIGIIEYSHDHSRFYIHGYTCIKSEYLPSYRVFLTCYSHLTESQRKSYFSRFKNSHGP